MKIIPSSLLRTGDVILSLREGVKADKVASLTNSRYTHAAICYDNDLVAEVAGRAAKTPQSEFLAQSPYHAVFRQLDQWTNARVARLRSFVDTLIENGSAYDGHGFKTFLKRKQEHFESIQEKVWQYFSGSPETDPAPKSKFFCSEFVAACLVASGHIAPSAAVIYQADTFSPGDIGRDHAFGYFVGYITKDSSVTVPDDDEFANKTLFTDILLSHHSTSQKDG